MKMLVEKEWKNELSVLSLCNFSFIQKKTKITEEGITFFAHEKWDKLESLRLSRIPLIQATTVYKIRG